MENISNLFEACCEGDLQIVKEYLEREIVDIEAKDNNGNTPLNYASRNGKFDAVKFLVEEGADIEAKSNDGDTPLIWASRHGEFDIVKFLVEKGADIEAKGNDGNTFIKFLNEDQKKEMEEIIEDILHRKSMVKRAPRV